MKTVEGWQPRTLRQLALINYGRSPAGILADEGQYPVVGTGGAERSGNEYLYDGDSIILGRKGTIDRVYFATGKFWTIDTAYYLSGFADALPRWLFYFLQTLDLRQMNEATGVPSLSRELLYKIEVLTPPEPEQTKIAEILLTVDRALEHTKALIAKQQRIKTGLMQDLLTRGIDADGNLRSEQTHKFKDSRLGRIPVEWDVESLDRCVRNDSPICYGILMPGAAHDNGVPVVKVRDIGGGKILQNGLLLTDPKIDRQYKRSRLREGDVLITIRGTTGRIAMVPRELDGANITQDTARVRLKQEHSNYYFYFLLQSKGVQDQVSLHTVGQAVKGINIGDVKKIFFGLPKKNEQLAIAARLQDIQTNLDNTDSQLGKLLSLKTALMQDLLTGKRRVTCLLDSEPKREKVYATS